MQNKRYIKNFLRYIVYLKEKEIPPQGFPRGSFPPQYKMGEKPRGFFIQKLYLQFLAQRSFLHSVFKVVRILYQKWEVSISPLGESLKYTLPKWQCIDFRLMAENGFAPPREFCRHIVS